jgi:hypothetical protein
MAISTTGFPVKTACSSPAARPSLSDDGIRGKDYVVVQDGNITVNAQGDGVKADNAEEAESGYISVEAGTLNITAGGDALDAATDVIITGGELVLSSGGGTAPRAETPLQRGSRLPQYHY